MRFTAGFLTKHRRVYRRVDKRFKIVSGIEGRALPNASFSAGLGFCLRMRDSRVLTTSHVAFAIHRPPACVRSALE